MRTNANVRPSGETAGLPSPNAVAGGVVSRRFSPVTTDNTKKLRGSPRGARSVVTRYLLSADQDRYGGTKGKMKVELSATVSAIFRSGPPREGIRSTSILSPRSRMKAIERPSGDQAGKPSTAAPEGSRRGGPPPICLT